MLGHVGGPGRRRKHRCKETFEDIIRKAIDAGAGSYEEAIGGITEKAVILMDGCDVWMSSSTFRFGNAVAALVRSCPKLVILATARNGLFVHTSSSPLSSRTEHRSSCMETTIPIPPFSNYHSALLLCSRCPRPLTMSEMYGGIYQSASESGSSPLHALSNQQIVLDLGGVPAVIAR